MILYRCGRTCPEGTISPSNWATNSIALEFFVDQCEERMVDCGDKIFVIDLPRPDSSLIGNYFQIKGRRVPEGAELPFGDDGNGWWSFNQPYRGIFKVVDVLGLESLTFQEIDRLDYVYKPGAVA